MEQPFSIQFDFPIAHTDATILLTATAQLNHAGTYYIVQDFHFATGTKPAQPTSLLPPQEIKLLEKENTNIWVHKDSERESLLSRAIGKAIEIKNNG